MADFTDTTTLDTDAQTAFAHLSDVRNLPSYFARMTSAEPADGEAVHTTAQRPDGTEEEGEAWFRVREDDQRIEWGSEGPSEYHGYLDVRPGDQGCEVEVHLHTTRVDADEPEVVDGIRETLANIKSQLDS